MSEKLKPCPFCGSESAPKIIVYYKSAYVSCDIDDGGCGAEFDSLPGEHAAIAAWKKRADQAKELAALRAFAQEVMDCWPDGWGIDGDDLQCIATEHGMLRPEIRNEPCGDGCRCADLVLPAEWNDGVVCYRQTALLTGADQC